MTKEQANCGPIVQCEASERVSGMSKWMNGWGSGLGLVSRFLVVLNHCAAGKGERGKSIRDTHREEIVWNRCTYSSEMFLIQTELGIKYSSKRAREWNKHVTVTTAKKSKKRAKRMNGPALCKLISYTFFHGGAAVTEAMAEGAAAKSDSKAHGWSLTMLRPPLI